MTRPTTSRVERRLDSIEEIATKEPEQFFVSGPGENDYRILSPNELPRFIEELDEADAEKVSYQPIADGELQRVMMEGLQEAYR